MSLLRKEINYEKGETIDMENSSRLCGWTDRNGLRRHVKESRQVPGIGYAVFARLENVCQDHQMEEIVSAIEKNAHTGKFDDGSISVSSIDESVRIGAGQHGTDSI